MLDTSSSFSAYSLAALPSICGLLLERKTDARAAKSDVRFTPESGRVRRKPSCPLRARSGHVFATSNLIECELSLGCLRSFSARRGALGVRYVHSLVFSLEVLKHEQADRRG